LSPDHSLNLEGTFLPPRINTSRERGSQSRLSQLSYYTYLDDVSGKVTLDTTKEETILFIYVFFFGVANIKVRNVGRPPPPHQFDNIGHVPLDATEVLFQIHEKLYHGKEKLEKKAHYEWPFRFRFQSATEEAENLPTSGSYPPSKVEYKIVVTPGVNEYQEERVLQMMDLRTGSRELPFSPTGLTLKLSEKMLGGVEEKLQFIQFRPGPIADPTKRIRDGGGQLPIELPTHLLPGVKQRYASVPKHILFGYRVQVTEEIVIGAPFCLLLAAEATSDASELWTDNPQPVTLKSCTIMIDVVNISSTDKVHFDRERYGSQPHSVWEGKHLNIPLSSDAVDIARIFAIRIMPHSYIIPSFKTELLQREYILWMEISVEISGKSFSSKLRIHNFNLIMQDFSEALPLEEHFNQNNQNQKGKGKASWTEQQDIQLPSYGLGRSSAYENELVKGVEKGMDLKGGDEKVPPAYEPGHKKHHFWDKKEKS
jgi:hypothetical protein